MKATSMQACASCKCFGVSLLFVQVYYAECIVHLAPFLLLQTDHVLPFTHRKHYTCIEQPVPKLLEKLPNVHTLEAERTKEKEKNDKARNECSRKPCRGDGAQQCERTMLPSNCTSVAWSNA